MKILYVSHKPPVPNVDGGTFAMKQFADVLTEVVEADAFVLATHKHPFTEETNSYLTRKFRKFNFEFIHTEIKLLPFLWSFLTGKSYILQRFQSQKLKVFLESNTYDLIVCDSLFALYALNSASPNNPAKIWLRSHNVEFINWWTLSDQQSFIKKRIYIIQSRQLKREELKLIKDVDLNLCISSKDQHLFKQILPTVPTKLLPIHVNMNPDLVIRNRECYFLGSKNWGPNIDTVNYLLECWKETYFHDHTLIIAGGFNDIFSPSEIPQSVTLIGRVDDLEEFIASRGILVTPSFSGSGIKVKILEALGLGVPVITTKAGAQGISEEAGLILVSDKMELLSAIEKLKSDNDYFENISAKGKSYIQKMHSFALVKSIIEEALGE